MGCKNCPDTKSEASIMAELDKEMLEETEEKTLFSKKKKDKKTKELKCKCGCEKSHCGICDDCGDKIG